MPVKRIPGMKHQVVIGSARKWRAKVQGWSTLKRSQHVPFCRSNCLNRCVLSTTFLDITGAAANIIDLQSRLDSSASIHAHPGSSKPRLNPPTAAVTYYNPHASTAKRMRASAASLCGASACRGSCYCLACARLCSWRHPLVSVALTWPALKQVLHSCLWILTAPTRTIHLHKELSALHKGALQTRAISTGSCSSSTDSCRQLLQATTKISGETPANMQASST